MATPNLYGIPYVPGRAQGRLQRHIQHADNQDILLLRANELSLLSTPLPAGLIIIEGAPYSHIMIQQLSLGIPIVIISAQQAELLTQNSYLQLDGGNGEIKAIDPATAQDFEPPPTPTAGQSIATADGVPVYLNASVSNTAAAELALSHGAAAVGLVRSEFLQPADGRIPDKEFYQHGFGEIGKAAEPLALTIRLLDLAPDKKPPWLPTLTGMQGPSGLQGVRLYQFEQVQQVVQAQLAAIEELSKQFRISLLIPYVTTSREFRHWRDTIKSQLSTPITVGAMLETPAPILEIDHWLSEADFIGVGCNDLMQCLFAADRDLTQLQHYLNPYSPALLRFLHQAAICAGDKIRKIQLCGLMAQWPGILPLLLGMGYTSFSIEPPKIPYLAQSIRLTNVEKMQPIIEQACNAPSAQAVCELLNVPAWPAG